MGAQSHAYNGTQEQILRVIREAGGDAVSSHIKDEIDSVGRSAVEKQLGNLTEMGAVEVVGEGEAHGGGIPPKVYGLTAVGGDAARRLAVDEETPEVDESETDGSDEAIETLTEQVRALRAKVMKLEDERDELRETVDEQAGRIDDLEAEADRHEDRLDTLRDQNLELRDRLS